MSIVPKDVDQQVGNRLGLLHCSRKLVCNLVPRFSCLLGTAQQEINKDP